MKSGYGKTYHRYIEDFISFLVPGGKRILRVEVEDEGRIALSTGAYDYIILSDVLGRVYDVQALLISIRGLTLPESRLIITQYSALWEPILRLASFLKLRSPNSEQNWLSAGDIVNFLTLADFEVVTMGRKLLLPVYVPLLSALLNRYIAQIPLINRLCLVNYFVARSRPTLNHRAHNPSVSIVIPARNEAGTIQRIIDELPALGAFTELIFIEGNSSDHTRAEIEKRVAKYRGSQRLLWSVQSGRGKGDAVRKGFAMATGDVLMIYDADMTVPASEIQRFYSAITESRGEFINGSRLVYPMEKESMRLLNFIANKCFGILFSWILGQRLKDTLCGTKVLWRADYADIIAGRSFFGDFDPFGDFDLLFGAAKLNKKIVDLPVHYKERTYGSTNISRFSHGWLLLKMVIFAARKIKFR
ncbi:MAG TPA: glycosyl transferase [Candidatus Vogelbacteria bacterium]|uniref:Glycosyltransferase 2-like domain-containing protein n=1 Tax=Candidatus Vogelbacteria bacterium RIFOXYD1_FULL_51_18 TaxID=1802440 RepID=A0A1G2QLF8_9BACT|nr:MAG: hypothetical protein UY66_C0018G0010 [Parcubacteria group bacterium GW2011_GWC1_51_35]KKW24844.1 MAG: hypothetical protein UY68_C0007G0022 [Parcubacteria group bacterium GW2011_GWF2_52_12]OHA60919.1 MAG: hypothetical protein A2569_00115 [Candidatus Vogelbacteria bacterium RIFOXYD1_FULL_51_18]HBB65070.1 glycosyl transferase [Candidatus Vogelbacteria bacterium]HBC44002.1 glycosyl transferase [Candidatus Vogelbacteria bacterium]